MGKEINIICEKCNKKYTKADVDSLVNGKQFIGGYCDKCSKEYQIERFGKIIER